MIWKILTIVFATTSVALLLLLVRLYQREKRLIDRRLIGTWTSDKERTQKHFPDHMTQPEKDKLSEIFGKLRITFAATTMTSEIDGQTTTNPYAVLGMDEYSVVVREDCPPIPHSDLLRFSSFSKIYFEDNDSFRITPEAVSFPEYFRRVRSERE